MAVNVPPSEDKMKIHSKHFKEENWERPADQLSYILYGDPDLIVNCITYIMNWNLWRKWQQEGWGSWEIRVTSVKFWRKKLAESSYSINQRVKKTKLACWIQRKRLWRYRALEIGGESRRIRTSGGSRRSSWGALAPEEEKEENQEKEEKASSPGHIIGFKTVRKSYILNITNPIFLSIISHISK